MTHTVIIGGGISGLSAAFFLLQRTPEARVTLLEASSRFGGVLGTTRRDGFLLERAADNWLARPPQLLQLAEALGLDIIRPRRTRGPSLLLYARDRIQPLPLGTSLVLPTRPIAFLASPLLSWRGKLRAALEPLVPPGPDLGRDQSMGDFFTRRLGREFVDAIIAPILAGIYSGDVDQLSILSTFPRFPEMVRAHGSLFRGARAAIRDRPSYGSPFRAIRDGNGALIDALVDHLSPRADLRLDAPARAVTAEPDGRLRVHLEDSDDLLADHLVCATPSYRAAALLGELAPHLARDLDRIDYTSTAAVFVALDAVAARAIPASIGLLLPRSPDWTVKGITFMSNKYDGRAPVGQALVRLFVAGRGNEALLEQDDDAIVAACLRDLERLFGLSRPPLFTHVQRHIRRTPQYDVGHRERVEHLDHDTLPNLHLAGSAYFGIGMPACVARAHAVAEAIAP